jgi:para-nitrobenzyl esterase
MLKGGNAKEIAGLAKAMHGAWVAFARTGNPNFTGLPDWPAYRREDRMTMRFDSVVGAVGDLAGLNWRKAWPKSAQV